MEDLKKMQECLIEIAESQIYGNIDNVDAKELGEVIDMIKDLAEAVYYTTITNSMEASEYGTMYYDPMDESRLGSRHKTHMAPMKKDGGHHMSTTPIGGDERHREYPMWGMDTMMRDPREGKSGERRKMYMDGKGYKDKTRQMQELENYMNELAQDVTEMIADASMEEKTMLQQKLNTLAAKVK